MPKERNYNPVQAQRKAEKAKAAKKGIRRRNAMLIVAPFPRQSSADIGRPQASPSSKHGATRSSPGAIPPGSSSRSMTSRR
jgi:hypothetical protein